MASAFRRARRLLAAVHSGLYGGSGHFPGMLFPRRLAPPKNVFNTAVFGFH
jgi:hypothetical protein